MPVVGGASSSYHVDKTPVLLHPGPVAIAEMQQVRYRDMEMISTRLGRLGSKPKGAWLAPTASVLIGSALGAALGAIPLFSSDAQLDKWVMPTYLTTMVALALLAIGFLAASRSVKAERADSVQAIKEDYDKWLADYQQDLGNAATAP